MRTAKTTPPTTPPTHKTTTEDPELADRFNRVLGDTVEAMEESGIRYLFIGGIASGGLGRPRSTHDIDLFVMPEDAELALRALAKKNFETQKTDPSWLYKGWKENILVDVIFKSKGEIYLDSEMYQRMISAPFHGRQLKLVAPEDLLIIKAAAHSELTPNHWHDAIALLTHAKLDWDYLISRARRAPRRILSLLLYAQSNDVWVPNGVINELFTSLFGEVRHNPQQTIGQGGQNAQAARKSVPSSSASMALPPGSATVIPLSADRSGPTRAQATEIRKAYGVAHLKERLAEDPRTNELDIQVEQEGSKILLRGEVSQPERRGAVEEIVREAFPDCMVENQIRLLDCHEPTETEVFK